ncbi:flagellar hook basal-body protein [Candidatus Methylobacter oryzae]|uniref:Flagellar hook basal-body protein n=1 Tax=Candidatus Methylobacter oryzae TaxID=2497749 RepID=A0ABY3CHW3_9GAMM|nr:flagellar hook basal-body protein [Candidatus Methylobacter oryzae]TRX02964.1 flagellar hook basal-body protein [Candidatus Methylobacter oryzae]
MNFLIFGILVFFSAMTHADINYSGVWKDNDDGTFYSIHQSADAIAVAELSQQSGMLPPFIQGAIRSTDQDLDLAITGEGFFILELSDGSHAYTRDGRFYISADNKIINDRGERLVTERMSTISNTNIPKTLHGNTATKTFNCVEYFGCISSTQLNRMLIIDRTGIISLTDAATGAVVAIDRIPLASIHPQDYQFTGYPVTVKNQNAVSQFYPAEQASYAGIMQGALEQLEDDTKTWRSLTGKLEGNHARLFTENEKPDAANYFPWQEINFTDQSNAQIVKKCPANLKFCPSYEEIKDRQLIKIF